MAEAPHTYEEGTCPNNRCRRKLYLAPSVRVAQCPGCGEGFVVKKRFDPPVVVKKDRPPASPETQAWMMSRTARVR